MAGGDISAFKVTAEQAEFLMSIILSHQTPNMDAAMAFAMTNVIEELEKHGDQISEVDRIEIAKSGATIPLGMRWFVARRDANGVVTREPDRVIELKLKNWVIQKLMRPAIRDVIRHLNAATVVKHIVPLCRALNIPEIITPDDKTLAALEA